MKTISRASTGGDRDFTDKTTNVAQIGPALRVNSKTLEASEAVFKTVSEIIEAEKAGNSIKVLKGRDGVKHVLEMSMQIHRTI